jgi:predicted RND superfamily exporter protein
MKNLKDKILYVLIFVLILIIIFFHWKNQSIQNDMLDKLRESNRTIIEMDKTQKEADGRYAKLVNYYSNQNEMMQSIGEKNKELSKLLKSQGEKILMLNESIISLEGSVNSGDISFEGPDSNIINLSMKYPDSDDPFINWNGKIFTDKSTYSGEWKFGKLPIEILLTETDRGLWKSRIIGPDWLKVDSINVKSLPPKDFSSEEEFRKFGLIFGGGYLKSINQGTPNALTILAGAYYQNHQLLLNGTSVGHIGLTYQYRLNSKKKKK